MSLRVPAVYVDAPNRDSVGILYSTTKEALDKTGNLTHVYHSPEAWKLLAGDVDVNAAGRTAGVQTVFSETGEAFDAQSDIPFDLVANAFYFLSSWSEQKAKKSDEATRALFSESAFKRLDIPQTIVDDYRRLLADKLNLDHDEAIWPHGKSFGVVLSHDVDFIPSGLSEAALKGLKSVARSLLKHKAPGDAVRIAASFMASVARGNNPYRCIPYMIEREKEMGVSASYQVAVGRRHPNDVSYRIENDSVRDYLKVISDQGSDLCLHGSYRSTERTEWYVEEAELLAERLERPRGSRQHYLSFDFHNLFSAQEIAGVEYDMSVGFPDQVGFRSGFSHPYFPFNLKENRPFRVLEISLFLMDVTLRGYLKLKGEAAWEAIVDQVDGLKTRQGCGSIVWHPVLFAGARDPGFDTLYWKAVQGILDAGGLAASGSDINKHCRALAKGYTSFRTA